MRDFRRDIAEAGTGRLALVRSSGPLAGLRYFLKPEVTRVGRGPDNDIMLRGPEVGVVSLCHAEFRTAPDGSVRIKDLDSTNGTFVNGRRVGESALEPPCTIQFGAGGPELLLTMQDDAAKQSAERTLVMRPGIARDADVPPSAPQDTHDRMLQQAIARARVARSGGFGGHTMTIMREVIDAALHRTRRKARAIIAVLALLLIAVSAYSFWQIRNLRSAKADIDARIRTLETELARAGQESPEADQLISSLERYENQARALERSLFYRLGAGDREEFIRREVRLLMAEFGAESYSIPPEFVEQVHQYLRHYQGPDRAHMARVLGEAKPKMQQMRDIFQAYNLPPDLAYMILAESALIDTSVSSAGAAGWWQFTPATARALGLRVGDGADERYSAVKSTRAAAQYIRRLINEFGAGSSVMLAMAAYNVGPSRVRNAIYRSVNDPIRQRNFWYLYRRRALPQETREYVPKVIAAMIIGRNPKRFGF